MGSYQENNLGRTYATHKNSKKLVPIIQENKLSDLGNNQGDNLNEILVIDPKRRRLGQEETIMDEDVSMSPQDKNHNQKKHVFNGCCYTGPPLIMSTVS